MWSLIVLILFACSANEVVVDERDLFHRCDSFEDIDACYALRNAKAPSARSTGLSKACERAHEDACALLYEHTKAGENVGDKALAFDAAMTGCERGVADLCRKALAFGDLHADQLGVVERNRATLEALLAKAK
jgi:hypothetical protein